MFTPRISGQIAVALEQHRSYPYVVEANGAITPVEPIDLRTYPIDATARYHFLTDTRWKPFIEAGLHYVGAPTPESVGGVVLQIRRSFGIMLEGKLLLGDREPYDPLLRASVGLSWRF